ncbi:hypothetical protein KIW84_075019 [Lathyrus oleraceus]|uniref:Mediator of RNA polymerase II transcription subunit 21 n=2 Tax=Pisum sativum TaxID=3888 RepID=A0A9D4VU97_PEA|nr:hypothetical protein KIW84_075019 [Pisum sativum]
MVAEEVKALSDYISQVNKIIDHYGDSDGLAVPTSSICQMQSLMLLIMGYVADVLMCNITSAQEISDQVESNSVEKELKTTTAAKRRNRHISSPNYPEPPPAQPTEDGANFSEEPKLMSASLVKAAKQFDALVASLPISETGEEVQLKRIAELQAENDAIGQELQKQLEAAEKELNQVQELYSQATDNCLNLKKPDIS